MPQRHIVPTGSERDGADNGDSSRQGVQWFLGIGIDAYQEFPRLTNAVKDVEDVIGTLSEDYGLLPNYTITLFDDEAIRENIIDALDRLTDRVGEDDKLLIYFSGHGHMNPRLDMGFWIPHDAKKERTSQYIRNSTIRDYVKAIHSKHTLVISDACFSGSLFTRGASRSGAALHELEAIPSRWAICSGRHDEEVCDGEPGNNSPFAESILKVLRSNKLELLNVAKLADRVVEMTRSNYEQLPEGNPMYGVGHEGGQYIFHKLAKEEKIWEDCRRTHTPSAYGDYLLQFPNGEYADEALRRIRELEDEIAWAKAARSGTLSALFVYLRQNPNGKFVDDAKASIAALEQQEDATLEPALEAAEERSETRLDVSSVLGEVDRAASDEPSSLPSQTVTPATKKPAAQNTSEQARQTESGGSIKKASKEGLEDKTTQRAHIIGMLVGVFGGGILGILTPILGDLGDWEIGLLGGVGWGLALLISGNSKVILRGVGAGAFIGFIVYLIPSLFTGHGFGPALAVSLAFTAPGGAFLGAIIAATILRKRQAGSGKSPVTSNEDNQSE